MSGRSEAGSSSAQVPRAGAAMPGAAGVCLVFVAALGAAFAGGVAGGIMGGLLRSRPLMVAAMLPCILATARVAGAWLARRRPAPTPSELATGAVLYVAVSGLCSSVAGIPGLVVGLLQGGAVAWVLHHSARAATARPSGGPR